MNIRKLGIRALVTVALGPFILLCAWQGGFLFLALVSSIILLGLNEFYELAAQKMTLPQRLTGLASAIGICVLFYFHLFEFLWLVLAIFLVIAGITELFSNRDGPLLNLGTTFLGVLYVAFSLAFMIAIRELNSGTELESKFEGKVVILILLSIWICDSAAYILGSKIGRHKLFERVSPNKTIEGTVSGFVFALLTAYFAQLTFIAELSLQHALVIGAVCGSFGQVSDLLESLFKRDADVKDSSNLIPGHGGILDRFDSLILTGPVVYIYLIFVVF